MAGMNFLSEYMKDFHDEYILIGGNACALQFESLEANFRKTDDLDIVLLIEDKSQDFFKHLNDFLNNNGYIGKTFNGSNAGGSSYRFVLPSDKNNDELPVQIELFSRKPDYFDADSSTRLHITPIETGFGMSNFSAILLDDNLYDYIRSSRETVSNITTVNLNCLLGLKSIAWHANQALKNQGIEISDGDILKHPSDMLRIIAVLDETIVSYPQHIFSSLQESKDKFSESQTRNIIPLPEGGDFEIAIQYIENFITLSE